MVNQRQTHTANGLFIINGRHCIYIHCEFSQSAVYVSASKKLHVIICYEFGTLRLIVRHHFALPVLFLSLRLQRPINTKPHGTCNLNTISSHHRHGVASPARNAARHYRPFAHKSSPHTGKRQQQQFSSICRRFASTSFVVENVCFAFSVN